MAYNHRKIESRWQEIWESEKTFKTPETLEGPKYYVLDMFPYPSGSGLHVGHPVGYVATDIVARYRRMQGYTVLHPMGWDAFGLPAEQHAIEKNVHPEETTRINCDNYRRQLKLLGFSYDWDREISTASPDFYRWTQWIFMKLYEKGLAYQADVEVNWCPALGTVLANDEIIDGVSERGGHPVEKKAMRQWMLRITEYADRLLEGLDRVDFPESLKAMQRERIGRSEGASIQFAVEGGDHTFRVFTTRPDTLFGSTFCVLSPEHPLVDAITHPERQEAVIKYREVSSRKSEIDRTGADAGKTGEFTGAFAINPVNGERLPIWIADYVLMGYGTGAIMCVPGHDQRDWDFAKTFDLPIREVIEGGDVSQQAYSGEGPHTQSGFLDGLNKENAIKTMIEHLEKENLGEGTVNYRMRDWIFARQRYWGEPVPVVHHQGEGQNPDEWRTELLAEADLPLELPPMENIKPSGDGGSPLSRLTDWVNIKNADGTVSRRETDTMPGSAGSSWYFLRYIDPLNSTMLCDPEKARYWMPVDLYVGGSEHAVGHLIYSRFWTKFLYDIGVCPVDEPYNKLVNQGMMLGEDSRKMGKRYGNVINPDDVCEQHGADSLRLFEMFLGPIEKTPKIWSTKGIEGIRRFLDRVSRLVWKDEEAQTASDNLHEQEDSEALEKLRHKTIKAVTEDLEALRFNTAISRMMEFVNELTKQKTQSRQSVETLVCLLSPFAPHLCEELWQSLGHSDRLAYGQWPSFDADKALDEKVEIAVQINGKVRARLEVEADASKDRLESLSLNHDKIVNELAGRQPHKVIVVPGRMVNIVVKQ